MKISTRQGPQSLFCLKPAPPLESQSLDGNPTFLVLQDKTFLHPQVLPLTYHTSCVITCCWRYYRARLASSCHVLCYHAVQASITTSHLITALAPAQLPPAPSALLPTWRPEWPFSSVGQFASLFCSQPSEAACHCSTLQSPSHRPCYSPSSPLASLLWPLGFTTVASLPPRSMPCEPPPGGLGLTVRNTPAPGVPLIRGGLL